MGDIGPKPAYNGNDYGYARFNNIKIPRTNMLMGHASLDSQGKFTKPSHAKAVFATMTSGRTNTHVCAFQLAQAVTITIRYSVVREQGHLPFENGDAFSHEIPMLAFKS